VDEQATTTPRAAPSKPFRTELLQADANRWLRKLRAEGFLVPNRVVVYTNFFQFESAAGVTHRQRGAIDGSDLSGDSRRSKTGIPIVYVRMRFTKDEKRVDPRLILIHELLHHAAFPDLPHWKVYALEKLFYERRNVQMIQVARSRADYARLRAKFWLDWPRP